jgi:hypothetical protein
MVITLVTAGAAGGGNGWSKALPVPLIPQNYRKLTSCVIFMDYKIQK